MAEKSSKQIALERIKHALTANANILNLRELQIDFLPPEIGDVAHLELLDISDNLLENLPDEIAKLQDLTELFLHRNKFANIPLGVCKLQNLRRLNLSQNNLTDIPLNIGNLNNLIHLDLSENRFVDFPSNITKLGKLQSIKLSGNQLISIPSDIERLNNLVELDLSANKLLTIPPEIGSLNKLKRLYLNGNELLIPPEILSKSNDPKAILAYYFENGKRKPINEVKVLVVGQGSVGKTSVVQRLMKDKFNPNEIKTDGISINRWGIKNQIDTNGDHPPVQLNIWDFGGQEIMHATHQFFLTKRSLYVLVLDSRLTQEENRVEYWLKIIQSFSGNSPVLIVGNKIDQHPLDIDRTGLQRKYANVVGVIETSASTGQGIEILKGVVAEQINNLPHVHDLLPETWFTVKTKLEGLGQKTNFITHDKYNELCMANGVSDETSQRTLIGFLHDLGVVLNFQDDPRLEALGILNPEWVTNGVYKILNSHALFHNKGMLYREMLDEILNLTEYPSNKRLFIVDMMRKFELCYDIEPDKMFLVPDLLPKDEPYTGDDEWNDAVAFQYHYTILPSSIISRFIVRMNTLIYKTVWRSGVMLKKRGNTALIKADLEEKKVFIWVNGNNSTRRDFLSAIRNEFDAIHKTIIKLEVREKVPIPGKNDVVVDFEHLLKLERLNEKNFIPEGLEEHVNVRELLSGIGSETDRRDVDSSRNIQAKKNMPLRILIAIFVEAPRILGRTSLEIAGRSNLSDTTQIFVGYTLIVIAFLLLFGILDFRAVITWFKDAWRFFFPVK